MTAQPILQATGLTKYFGLGAGFLMPRKVVHAVDGVTLSIDRGETFAIVGESGCGKSTLARVLMGLLAPTDGHVTFDGQQVDRASGARLRALRRDMQFIFQDPFSSLNPRMSVGRLIGEPLEVHAPDLNASARRDRTATLLQQVGLRAEHADRYPHEFSGGQRQRIGIARALASAPRLIIADEPVSALDVSVQAQVINLLGDLRRDLGLTLVIIAHDLGVIRHMSDRVAIMYLGRIVEIGTARDIFAAPRHPYTHALLTSIPAPRDAKTPRATALLGEMPSPLAPPSGCRFHTRCPHAAQTCRTETPALAHADAADHSVACHFWRQISPPPPAPPPLAPSTAAKARFALYRAATEGGKITHKNHPTERTDQ